MLKGDFSWSHVITQCDNTLISFGITLFKPVVRSVRVLPESEELVHVEQGVWSRSDFQIIQVTDDLHASMRIWIWLFFAEQIQLSRNWQFG